MKSRSKMENSRNILFLQISADSYFSYPEDSFPFRLQFTYHPCMLLSIHGGGIAGIDLKLLTITISVVDRIHSIFNREPRWKFFRIFSVTLDLLKIVSSDYSSAQLRSSLYCLLSVLIDRMN